MKTHYFLHLLLCCLVWQLHSQAPSVSVYFRSGSAALSPAMTDSLKRLQADDALVVLKGYTDSTGGALRNMWLSEQRVLAVGGMLMPQIPLTNIRYEYYGESALIPGDNAQNRRVDVFIKKERLLPATAMEYVKHPEQGVSLRYDKNNISQLKLTTIRSSKAIIQTKMYALHQDGTPLLTDGMMDLSYEAKATGTMNITMASNGNYDPEMILYDGIEQPDGSMVWVESSDPMSYDAQTGTYNITTQVKPGKSRTWKNLDRKAKEVRFLMAPDYELIDGKLSLASSNISYVRYADSCVYVCFAYAAGQTPKDATVTLTARKNGADVTKNYLVNTLKRCNSTDYLLEAKQVANSAKEAPQKTYLLGEGQQKKRPGPGFFKRLMQKLRGGK